MHRIIGYASALTWDEKQMTCRFNLSLNRPFLKIQRNFYLKKRIDSFIPKTSHLNLINKTYFYFIFTDSEKWYWKICIYHFLKLRKVGDKIGRSWREIAIWSFATSKSSNRKENQGFIFSHPSKRISIKRFHLVTIIKIRTVSLPSKKHAWHIF